MIGGGDRGRSVRLCRSLSPRRISVLVLCSVERGCVVGVLVVFVGVVLLLWFVARARGRRTDSRRRDSAVLAAGLVAAPDAPRRAAYPKGRRRRRA